MLIGIIESAVVYG